MSFISGAIVPESLFIDRLFIALQPFMKSTDSPPVNSLFGAHRVTNLGIRCSSAKSSDPPTLESMMRNVESFLAPFKPANVPVISGELSRVRKSKESDLTRY